MAIDPLLYEKLSGRKGDPYSRMGEALAGAEKGKAAVRAEKDVPLGARVTWSHYKYKMIFGVGTLVLIIVVLILALFR